MSLLEPFNKLSLPGRIGKMTIDELINLPETDVIKKGNKLLMRRESEEGTTSVEFVARDSGYRSMEVSSAPRKEYKKDYSEDIRQMKREGKSQKDIAFQLGISEAYVSQLLNGRR